jgi:hypothetical protein
MKEERRVTEWFRMSDGEAEAKRGVTWWWKRREALSCDGHAAPSSTPRLLPRLDCCGAGMAMSGWHRGRC